MTFQKVLTKDMTELRCVNIIKKKDSKKYGLVCNTLIAKINSNGKIAGEFKCRTCNALYEVKNMVLILKDCGGKK